MLVFNNQQRSGYEEIASYSPRYYRRIREMDAVFRLAGWLVDLMAKDMEGTVAGQFLKYMDDEALTRYEAFLEIMKDPNKTMDARKAYIKALLIGSGKLSAGKIAALVNQFSGCGCDDVILDGSVLHVIIGINENLDSGIRDELYDLIRRKVPAHIGMDVVFDNSMSGKLYFGAVLEQADIMEIRQR